MYPHGTAHRKAHPASMILLGLLSMGQQCIGRDYISVAEQRGHAMFCESGTSMLVYIA